MAVSCVLSDAGRDLLGDALHTALSTSTGVLEILEGASLLVTFDLVAGTSVNGVITFAAPGAESATGAGTADTAILYSNAKATTYVTLNVGIGAGFSVNLDNNVIAVSQVVTLSSCVVTIPAGT